MRALILTGKYAQDIEVFYPKYRMEEERWKVDIAILGDAVVEGIYGMRIVPTIDISVFGVSDFDCLILPGGARAMEYLRQSPAVINTIKSFYGTGKVVAAICHGTQLLISAGLTKGKRISGYYSIKDDIVNSGATFIDAPFVTDGSIVTCPHYRFLGPWMREVMLVTYSYRDLKSV